MSKIESLQTDRLEQQVASRNPVGDLPNEDRTEQLVDVMLTSAFENLVEQGKIVSWAKELYERYSGLPERTVGQKKS